MQFHQMRRVILYLIHVILSIIGILHLIQMANCKLEKKCFFGECQSELNFGKEFFIYRQNVSRYTIRVMMSKECFNNIILNIS